MPAVPLSQISRQILVHGLDDWVHLPEVRAIVLGVLERSTEGQIRGAAIEALSELANSGLIEIGVVTTNGFQRSHETPDTCLARIAEAWSVEEPPWNPGASCWFRNTAAGDQHAREARESDKQ